MNEEDDTPEATLIARAKQGDGDAFGALCARYETRLRGRVDRRLSAAVRRRVSASDIIQEAHIVAFEQMAEFEDRGSGSFGHWLARIVDLKAQQLVRHHAGTAKRAVSAEVTRAQRATIGSARGRGDSPSQIAIGAEMREATKHAMARLPATYRQVIHLIQGEGLTLEEAGVRMERTRDSIKGLYSRALGRLARELELDRKGR